MFYTGYGYEYVYQSLIQELVHKNIWNFQLSKLGADRMSFCSNRTQKTKYEYNPNILGKIKKDFMFFFSYLGFIPYLLKIIAIWTRYNFVHDLVYGGLMVLSSWVNKYKDIPYLVH